TKAPSRSARTSVAAGVDEEKGPLWQATRASTKRGTAGRERIVSSLLCLYERPRRVDFPKWIAPPWWLFTNPGAPRPRKGPQEVAWSSIEGYARLCTQRWLRCSAALSRLPPAAAAAPATTAWAALAE